MSGYTPQKTCGRALYERSLLVGGAIRLVAWVGHASGGYVSALRAAVFVEVAAG